MRRETVSTRLSGEAAAPRDRICNWLALLVLVSLGFVWPPLFGAARETSANVDGHAPDRINVLEPGGPVRFVAAADWTAGAGITPPRLESSSAAHAAAPIASFRTR